MGKILVDQQHPNLFYVDRLAQLYPRAVFIYPDRSAVQIVASMLNHDGVGGWYGKLKSGTLDVPYPNRFFGIESREQLMTEPLHLLCLRRVAAHKLAATEARRRHGQRFRYLNYEALVRDRLGALREVFSPSEFLQFGEHQQTTESNISSLEKYKSALTDSQIEEIESLEARLGFA